MDRQKEFVLRTLEDSGKIRSVARPASGIRADYRLVLDLRRFDSDYAGAATPSAVIELNAGLNHDGDDPIDGFFQTGFTECLMVHI